MFSRFRIVSLSGAFALALSAAGAANKGDAPVTFYKDVLPVLQRNCQSCHRDGEVAPMPLLTYSQVRPLAKAIRQAVLTQKMPPWFADPHYGKWANDRTLSKADANTLVSWADTGAREGNPKEAPAPLQFVDGWQIGKPDLVVEMPMAYPVPASGTLDYVYFVMPTGFTEDKWIRMAEARPGNRALVHHIIAFVREPGSRWLKEAKPGEAYIPPKNSERPSEGGAASGRRRNDESAFGGEFFAGYAPGTVPDILKPGQARLIKAGSDIVFQMHYTANGTAGTDRSRVGFRFATEPVKERVFMLAAATEKFAIPPGDPNYRVDAAFTLNADSKMVELLPHMHLRGKSFEYRAIYPDGRQETLLKVPAYDFNWQLSYLPREEMLLPKGTRIECTAYYDNSPNNPRNPDPKVEVTYGEQSWDEMMFGFFSVAFDANMNPRELFPPRPKRKGAAD